MPHFNEINIYSLVNEYTICVIFSANIFASVAMLPKSSIVKTVKRNVKSDKRESNEKSTSIGSIFNMPTWKINLWHQNKTNSGDLARFMRFSVGVENEWMMVSLISFPDYQIWNVVNVCAQYNRLHMTICQTIYFYYVSSVGICSFRNNQIEQKIFYGKLGKMSVILK